MDARADLVTVSLRVDRATIRRYAEITDDFNPIHVDPEFAASTPMGGIIAHGMLSMNLIWQALRATHGGEAARGARLEVRFVRPVREDDTVSVRGRPSANGSGSYDVTVVNQQGEPVITGTLSLGN